jgi:hypothetical protein
MFPCRPTTLRRLTSTPLNGFVVMRLFNYRKHLALSAFPVRAFVLFFSSEQAGDRCRCMYLVLPPRPSLDVCITQRALNTRAIVINA